MTPFLSSKYQSDINNALRIDRLANPHAKRFYDYYPGLYHNVGRLADVQCLYGTYWFYEDFLRGSH